MRLYGRSLPHRQLRKSDTERERQTRCSLPHRQLRKAVELSVFRALCSLPHRQLRKEKLPRGIR